MAESVSLRLELENFVRRCPNLSPNLSSYCDNLLKKGDKINDEDLVIAMAELLLHPNCTIPLLGSFRSIASKILERTIKLLSFVLDNMDLDKNFKEFNEDEFLTGDGWINCNQISIINFYVTSGQFLALHELACLAFCRALDLLPFLLRLILNYYKFAPCPFKGIILCRSLSDYYESSKGSNRLLNVVRISYRFLSLEPKVFSVLWDWSCIMNIFQLSIVNDARLQDIRLDLRWFSAHILSVVLKLSFKASAKLGLGSEDSFHSFLRWKEFCMDVSLEKAGWYLESSTSTNEAGVGRMANTKDAQLLKQCHLSSLSSDSSVAKVIVASDQIDTEITRNPDVPFFLTSSMTKSFEMVSLAVSQRWPVLLYGPPGSGKTALINHLAHGYGNRVLSIHMDDQIDGKTLLGTYVCTEQPGEFRWQPGSLTQAVLKGFWVIFEDIDKAPADIQSILLPLLEGAVSFSTGHGEAIRVNDSFRLFSTVTSSNSDTSCFIEGRNSLVPLWRKVMVDPPSNQDLINIVLVWCPGFGLLATKLIETFEKVNRLTRSQFGLTASSNYHDRFTLRDLLKLCKRVERFGQGGISTYVCECICKEAIDVFASFSTSVQNRLDIMREICKLWTVAAAETLYPANKPSIQELKSVLQIGRASLPCAGMLNRDQKPFVELRSSAHALERIACSVQFNEPVLLVGETGTGKTTLVQTLASRLGQKLTVLNLSQQSDVADLLGGFKPVDARFVCSPLYKEFKKLFNKTFSSKENEEFLGSLRKFLVDKNWKMLFSGFRKGSQKIIEIVKSSPGKKRKRPLGPDLLKDWVTFSTKLERACAQINASDGMVFSFVEGAFITALKNGEWILLDEVNLAPADILQRVIGVLEDEKGSLCLAERGDIDYVVRNPSFRLFACMNPATDAGKRDLAISLRNRFTEYYVDDVLDDEDLVLFISQFMDDDPSYGKLIHKIVQFYKVAKESEERLQDGANQKPRYNLRSLYRALEYFKKAKRHFRFEKSLYDGFCMFFLSLLDETSARLMNSLIRKHLLGGGDPPAPLPFDSYLMDKAHSNPDESYVLTNSVKEHLKNLARAIFIERYPVLLQGPTSSGKTSLVRFLATITGHEFIRINNHEHTDLQEYLGSYITDTSGKLVFQEGALVKAVRRGQWIVLDELNLAPSDVLEALNRLLDDNRELFVPELRETIRAHRNFMLFATQNPPIVYGGRKTLSRAFLSRFVEIHVDEIPQDELSEILEQRCKIPRSYARKMVEVMKDLQLNRQGSKIFAGKHGFITPRDLFRWADRCRTFKSSYEDLAYDGYYLMAERLRDDAEKKVVKEVLEKHLRIKFSDQGLYKQGAQGEDGVLDGNKFFELSGSIGKIIWTKSLQRMYFLVERCYKMREPVLLVGETGGGKTTVCQLLSVMLGSKLHILNCHQYTETSDFLGGFFPVRERSRISMDFQNLAEKLVHSKAFIHFPGDINFSWDIDQASVALNKLSVIIKSYRDHSVFHPDVTEDELGFVEKIYLDLGDLHKRWRTIFMWQDGPLVEAMKNGDLFLVDEISLADDSVLERLNSVLEPERKLSLVEKGGSHLENIVAHKFFSLLSTMNPGGDYGKKELSPALRNRFTEIWVPSVNDLHELKDIAVERIKNPELGHVVDAMVDFWQWFNGLQTGRTLTVRDLLSWVSFINVTEKNLVAESAFIHGVFLILLDGLTLGTSISKDEAIQLRTKCVSFLLQKLKEYKPSFDPSSLSALESYGWPDPGNLSVPNESDYMDCDNLFGIDPFYIEKGTDCIDAEGFKFQAPTTHRNTIRVLRAMQLDKPVLLEGSPGVGKTSLVVAIGRFSGHNVVRINLSEQTDIMDLLGSDLPVESDDGIRFAWSDGILLQALKKGSWVLLDELNLAPQSVLEGLNAVLDHRAEVFIPELGRSFKCPASFRVFACQNPSYQGGGRKGLPKSFLNRFTKVYVDELGDEDYISICSSLFPSVERSVLSNLVVFNKKLQQEIMLYHKFGQDGSPWEFNLRDVIRSCRIIKDAPESTKSDCFLNPIYLQRMRTPSDRVEVMKLHKQIFKVTAFVNPYPSVKLDPDSMTVGNVSIERNLCQSSVMSNNGLKILPGLRHSLETVAQCVKYQWLCILVGSSSSGKTSLIRLAAGLTGNVLNELNLSSATDISELLGCFEQYSASRHYHLAVTQVERYINEYCNLQLESSLESFTHRKDLTTRWLAFLSKINSFETLIDNPRMSDSIPQLVEIIECLKLGIDGHPFPISWSQKDLDIILDKIRKLEDLQKKHQSVKFEWVTGLLIKAIENGEWIVLENANLCNPTVLDRINSLVEQSGSITINECGIAEGNPVVLHPHPNFRMFLTVNPNYGEVSRAMRNRGVEIYLMQPDWLVDKGCDVNLDKTEFREVRRFIVLSGIPMGKLVDVMARAHIYAKHEGTQLGINITYLELSRWMQLFHQLVASGNSLSCSIHISWEHTYLSSFGKGKGKEIVYQAAASYLSGLEIPKFTSNDRVLSLPPPLKLWDYVSYSKEACVLQNVSYLESLGSQIDTEIVKLIQNKLAFAADWVMEQASEKDCRLYIQWFEWFGSRVQRVQPLSSFFNRFSDLLKKELQHSIWTRIFQLRRELMSLCGTGSDSISLPMLSMELTDVCPSAGVSKSSHVLLNAIKCVKLLRLSLQQWREESELQQWRKESELRQWRKESECDKFEPILTFLRRMEEKALDLLVESPSFDVPFKSYSNLLHHHMFFWNSIITSKVECQQVYLRCLMKEYIQLGKHFPAEELFQTEMKGLDFAPSLCLDSSKPLLWKHGGHPILPSSEDIYHKQCQLSYFCESVWPRERLGENDLNHDTVDGVLRGHAELRVLSMQGLCVSSYVIGKVDGADLDITHRLEEMHQMLLGRFDYEKKKLAEKLATAKPFPVPELCSLCCIFTTDVLCRSSGLECWLKMQPMVNETSLSLDLELLQHLMRISVADIEEQRHALLKLSDLLRISLNFSLDHSSRSPSDFVPHQKLLFTLDAWESVHGANEKIASSIMGMWFRWHAALWEPCPTLVEILPDDDACGIVLPHKLFCPLKLASVNQILQNTSSIEDYHLHSFNLRVASRDIWRSSAHMVNLHNVFMCVARSLFQQMIHAHRKSFDELMYAKIRPMLHSTEKLTSLANVELLVSYLASSNHHVFTSLIDYYIKPLLVDLYSVSPSNDIKNVGCALLQIGGLRYNLLVLCYDLDPMLKYSVKYADLTAKIDSLEVEIQVRKECNYLAGSIYQRQSDSYRINLLEKLNAERRWLQKKMVFRPPTSVKFKELKRMCDEFLDSVTAVVEWARDFQNLRIEQINCQVLNWQETTSHFIDQLSKEYSEYIDVVEPVQVAIYEMKLGLSLIVSGVLYRRCLANGEQDMESVLITVYQFMRYPRVCASELVSLNAGSQPKLFIRDIYFPSSIEQIDLNKLQTASGLANETVSTRELDLPLMVSIYHNVLARLKCSVVDAHFLGASSNKLLHKIFDDVANAWMEHRLKQAEEGKALQFKFRTRVFNIASIISMDLSNCENLLADDTFSEWQELLSENLDEKVRVNEEDVALEQDWNVQETDLDGIVNIHGQLFGSADLVQRPGRIQVSDTERLSSFNDSYKLGIKMTQGLKGSFSSIFDVKISPEILFRVCLEHDDKFICSHKSMSSYNFYKDLNPPMMAKLVEPIERLKQRILVLLTEWDDHPSLQKILEVIDMILALPLSSSLAKALSALEFLLNTIRIVQETVAKFPLQGQLEPIFALVISWYKLEFESWPALLNEIQTQFERNAGKLWFPLYSVFQQNSSSDVDQYKSSMIESLEDFFRTSSIGEFKTRLQLLLSFHGQIKNDLDQPSTSICQEESVKILYNTFGFYVQLWPRILDHIGTYRRAIEKELSELLTLCHWQRMDNYMDIEKLKRNRLKLRKIVKKYTDLLQQPLMEFLGRETLRSGRSNHSFEGQKLLVDSFEISKTLLDTVNNQIQSKDNDSSLWLSEWRKRAVSVGEFSEGMKNGLPLQSYWVERKESWHKIENLCGSLIHCCELWENKNKLGKRRALSDLLKLLECCGLSKHRTSVEGQYDNSQSWLLQPSYEVHHLLLPNDPSGKVDADVDNFPSPSPENTWKEANKYYFKSIASKKVLEKICLNFHKDFTLVQVKRSGSFVDHLIHIQQEQRAVAYSFAKKVKCLRQSVWPLSNLFSSSIQSTMESISHGSFAKNQHATFKCLWQQKQLFDAFCSVLYEEHLILRTVENTHLNTCSGVKDESAKIRLLIQKFLPDFQKSKNALDCHLLGSSDDILVVGIVLHPFGVTKEMELQVDQNFELIRTFERNLSAFHREENRLGAVQHVLLGHIKDLFAKAHTVEELYSSWQEKKVSANVVVNITELESHLNNALKGANKHVLSAIQKLGSLNRDFAANEEKLKNIKDWKILFENDIEHLQLDLIQEDVISAIQYVGELIDCCGDNNPTMGSVYTQLRHLYDLLDMLLAFADNLLHDFLQLHTMISKVTYALANIFASLFTQGFGIEEQENDDDGVKEATKDASGTGMGEGAGLNDVSDQITDEDQLLGASDKPNEERDAMSEMPNKNEKGIEMEQDFDGEAFSLSEDSEDDENRDNQDDGDEQQLESAMGDVGDNGGVADEKLGDTNDDAGDENPEGNEKYEIGSAVDDKSSKDRELRAKEDSAAAAAAAEEDAGDLDAKESEAQNDENAKEDECDGGEDMSIGKDDAFLDPSGINPEDQSQKLDAHMEDDDIHMDEMEATDQMEDGESEDLSESDMKNDDGKTDEIMDEAGLEHSTENPETANTEESHPENDIETDLTKQKQNSVQYTPKDNAYQSVEQSLPDFSDTADLGDCSDLAPTSGQPNASELEVKVADATNGDTLSNEQSRTLGAPNEPPAQKLLPNPCRSVGNALDGWKERVKVSVDLQEQMHNSDDLADENADEYGYTAEFKEGTAQALGPATADQIKGDLPQNDTDQDTGNVDTKDSSAEVEVDKENSDSLPIKTSALSHVNDIKKQQGLSDLEKQQTGESMEIDGDYNEEMDNLSESLVSVKKSYMSENLQQFRDIRTNEDDLGKAQRFEPSADAREEAVTVWRRYDSHTTRLSQELAEQLRLIMEPTLASKLQGDYKTGKRINMKKVIPYVASHYRKDKIWLRRTKPSKRDYQVVIAVDDSRSMSEGHCGNFALEALVTVCRAMSHLEVGNLAVASFGQQGNIKLLHDFDEPFTPEAGIKMVSSFSFRQENTIVDEPMVELLKYLNNLLDAAVVRARLPSGYNPLQQLVLIIADGRFNEKEKLKQCVRDILSKRRMVAFILLDSPSESIMEFMEATVRGTDIKFTKYMDSFPFPYYVVLKNIEALPRTLGDLLRQWFELMQYNRE